MGRVKAGARAIVAREGLFDQAGFCRLLDGVLLDTKRAREHVAQGELAQALTDVSWAEAGIRAARLMLGEACGR